MNQKQLQWKVGLFLVVTLAVMAGLIMKFSKGAGLFTPTYILLIESENVGGIIPGAGVLLSGVPIGHVISTDINPEGRTVVMRAKILKKYQIHADANFAIRQAGFIGDRFIAVTPLANKLPLLKNEDRVRTEEAFDLQEVAKSTGSLIKKVDLAVSKLTDAVTRVDQTLLSGETLTNLTETISTFRELAKRALGAVTNVDYFVKTNTPALAAAITNFGVFSVQLSRVAKELEEAVVTNRVEFAQAIKNIQNSAGQINEILSQVQSGQGLAGTLLKNEELGRDVSLMVSNLNIFSENINKNGLWSVIRKPKAEKPEKSDRPEKSRKEEK